MDFSTRAAAIAAVIPASVNTVELAGFYSVGDRGGSTYRRLPSAPAQVELWHFQSADGAWWQLDEERINPKMLGAKINGIVDDTDAVQATFNYGRPLHRPVSMLPGTYIVNSISVPANSFIEAVGGDAILKSADKSGATITLSGSNITLRGVTLDGTHAVATYASGFINGHIGISATGTAADPLVNVIIENCKIKNYGHAGMRLQQINNLVIRGCVVARCGAIGIVGYSVWDGIIEYNRVDDIYPGDSAQGNAPHYNAYGIVVSNFGADRVSQRVRISGNFVSNVTSWEGIDEHNGQDISILSNEVVGCATGIAAEHHVPGQPLVRVFVENNIIHGFGLSKVRDGQTYRSQAAIGMRGGVFRDPATGVVYGDMGQGGRVVGNYVYNAGDGRPGSLSSGAIKCQNVRHPMISNNTIYVACGTGILLYDDGYDSIYFGLVEGNIIDGILSNGGARRGIYATGRVAAHVTGNFVEVDSGVPPYEQVSSATLQTTFADIRVT